MPASFPTFSAQEVLEAEPIKGIHLIGIKDLKNSDSCPENAFFVAVLSKILRRFQMDFGLILPCLWKPVKASLEDIKVLCWFLLLFGAKVDQKLTQEEEFFLWMKFGLDNIEELDFPKQEKGEMFSILLLFIVKHEDKTNIQQKCKVFYHAFNYFFHEMPSEEFMKTFYMVLYKLSDIVALTAENFDNFQLDYTKREVDVYRFRVLGELAGSGNSRAMNIIRQVIVYSSRIIVNTIRINGKVDSSLNIISHFLVNLLSYSFQLPVFRDLEGLVFKLVNAAIDPDQRFMIRDSYIRDVERDQPFCSMFETLAVCAQYASDAFLEDLELWFTICKKFLLLKAFIWRYDAKLSLLKAINALVFRLGIVEEVNPNKDRFDREDTYRRSQTVEFNEREMDTVLLTPLLQLLTGPDEANSVRLQALLLVGRLGALNPDMKQSSCYEDSAETNFFSDQRLLAKNEAFLDQSIVVKNAFEHSGFVKFSDNPFKLPALPSEKNFEIKAAALILLELLEFHDIPEAQRVMTVETLIEITKKAGKYYYYSTYRTFQVLQKILVFPEPEDPEGYSVLNEKIVILFRQLLFCSLPFTKFNLIYVEMEEFFIEMIPRLFRHHAGVVCSLAETMIDEVLTRYISSRAFMPCIASECRTHLIRLRNMSVNEIDAMKESDLFNPLHLLINNPQRFVEGDVRSNCIEIIYNLRPGAIHTRQCATLRFLAIELLLNGKREEQNIELVRRKGFESIDSFVRIVRKEREKKKKKEIVSMKKKVFQFDEKVDFNTFHTNYGITIRLSAIEKVIEFIDDENDRLQKLGLRDFDDDANLIEAIQDNRSFTKRFCSLMLQLSGNTLLRECQTLASVNVFVAEELLNPALLNILTGFQENLSDFDEKVIEELGWELKRMVRIRPSRKHLLLDFVEYSDRAESNFNLVDKEFMAELAAEERLYGKSIRYLESLWTQKGSLDREKKEMLLEYYKIQNIHAFVTGTDMALSSENENAPPGLRRSYSTSPVLEETKKSYGIIKSDLLVKYVRYRSQDYSTLYSVVLETMKHVEMGEYKNLKFVEAVARTSRSRAQYLDFYKPLLNNMLVKRFKNIKQEPSVLLAVMKYRDKLFSSLNIIEKDAWLDLAQKLRKRKKLEEYFFCLEKYGMKVEYQTLASTTDDVILHELTQVSIAGGFELLKHYWTERKQKDITTDVFSLVNRGFDYLINRMEGLEASEQDSEVLIRMYLKKAKLVKAMYYPDRTIRKKKRQFLSKFNFNNPVKRRNALLEIEDLLLRALALDRTNYKIWFRLSQLYTLRYNNIKSHLANYQKNHDMVTNSRFSTTGCKLEVSILEKLLEALFQCIKQGAPKNGTQSVVNLLQFFTVWTNISDNSQNLELVDRLGSKYFTDYTLGSLLKYCLPITAQLISFLYQFEHVAYQRHLKYLLSKLSIEYPQLLVFQLIVALKHKPLPVLEEIVADFKTEHGDLYAEAEIFANGMQAMAITPVERWQHSIAEARKYYQGPLKNINKMIAIIEKQFSLYQKNLENITEIEANFLRVSKKDIEQAAKHLDKYKKDGKDVMLASMWDNLITIFQNAERSIAGLEKLSIHQLAKPLETLKNTKLVVPGTLVPGAKEHITIAYIKPTFTILSSKQRPRTMTIVGSNGREYPFLLKGYEDLRQDQRILQIFGVINHLMSRTKMGKFNDLSLLRYAVTPLSTEVGIIGWVERARTLHSLVRDYRIKKGVPVNVEIDELFADGFEKLPVKDQFKRFTTVFEDHDGMDLAQILLVSAQTSQDWLKMKNNYCYTTAVNSMVGHLLAIGDRHPSNILFGFDSSKALHIDFGDSFGRAAYREIKPERVPFRLTRMMKQALGPQVNFTFKMLCEHTLKVLRKNKGVVLALLQPFIYDGLVDWFDDQMLAIVGMLRQDLYRNQTFFPLDPHPRGSPIDDSSHSRKAGMLLNSSSSRYDDVRWLSDKLDHIEFSKIVVERIEHILDAKEKVEVQVKDLVDEAGDLNNLFQMYAGWATLW